MNRKMLYGISAAAMLFVAPKASAGYWVVHVEVIKAYVQSWIEENLGDLTEPTQTEYDTGAVRKNVPTLPDRNNQPSRERKDRR